MIFLILLKQSFLNLFRNKRRSLMIFLILGASTLVVYLTNSYLEQMYRGMRLGYEFQSGSLQIARKGFWDVKRDGELLLDAEHLAYLEKLILDNESVIRVNRELSFQGLIGTDLRSTIVNGMGVFSENQGGYAGYLSINSGNTLDAFDIDGILIGQPIAEKLGVGIDDYVNLMSSTVDGSLNLISARIAGICTTGYEQADAYYCAGNLSFIQELRGTQGVERLLVFLREGSDISGVQNIFEKKFESEEQFFEIKTWEDLNPFYFELKALYDGIFFFIKIIICVLVFLSVTEIISMSFFERFRELGTLRAIGNTKEEIFLLLLFEVFFYALIGIVVGGTLGVTIASILNNMNLQWVPPGASNSVPFGFYNRVVSMISPALTILGASVIAAIIPALKSANKQIVDVIKYE